VPFLPQISWLREDLFACSPIASSTVCSDACFFKGLPTSPRGGGAQAGCARHEKALRARAIEVKKIFLPQAAWNLLVGPFSIAVLPVFSLTNDAKSDRKIGL